MDYTPHKIHQALTKFPAPQGKDYASVAEGDGGVWKYKEGSTDGALRLISVARLLSSAGPAIDLVEWHGVKAWPRDDLKGFAYKMPQRWPQYAAISHVWKPSEDAARISDEANRPLHIDVGGSEPHTISWLGLVQAATAARAHHCRYLWLDLLCLNQLSNNDKKMQIKQMAKIYRNATMVIVMPGGVVAAQDVDKPSSWVSRAWTLQEATLGFPIYVLVKWTLPGSFSYFSRLKGETALAPLKDVAAHPPGQSLGVSTLLVKGKEREQELDLPLRCLGDDTASLSALSSIVEHPSREDYLAQEESLKSFRSLDAYSCDSKADDSDDPDSEADSDDPDSEADSDDPDSEADSDDPDSEADFDVPKYEADSDDTDSEADSDDQTALTERFSQLHNSPDGCGPKYSPRFSKSIKVNQSPGYASSDSSSDSSSDFHHGDDDALDDDALPHDDEQDAEDEDDGDDEDAKIRHAAVWRSMWLRTSTKPQDLVFSTMHLLNASIEVDYKRSLRELIFELVEKTRSNPVWLIIGYDIPVWPESGLIPILPTFMPNSIPTYCIDGKTRPAAEAVCDGKFFCTSFSIDIKETSVVDGHLICGVLLDVESSDAPQVSQVGVFSYESKLHLSCPGYEVHRRCRFKGRIGSVLVEIGDYGGLDATSFGEVEEGTTPFVYFLEKTENGTWQKTGAGTLDEGLSPLNWTLSIKRRHLRVGGPPGAELAICDCPNASNPIADPEEDLDIALAHACSEGNDPTARQLIDLGANVNRVSSRYGSPVMAASFAGRAHIVEQLISHGAYINVPEQRRGEPWYGTPLHAACSKNFEAVARVLIEQGADVNAQGSDGSVLQAALCSENYNKQIVQLLLNHGANPNNSHGGMHGTALMAAQVFDISVRAAHAYDRTAELIELLIANGARVNSTEGTYVNEQGWVCRTALQMACQHGALNRVRLLLANGADVNLRSGGTFDTALQVAAYYRFPLICKALLDSGADIHIQGGRFGNALQAALSGIGGDLCEQIVRMLLEMGAKVDAEGGYYGNALQAASAMFHYEVVNLLLKEGANVNAEGGYYGNALQAASATFDSNYRVVNLLLKEGANVNARGGYYGTALQAAVACSKRDETQPSVIHILLSAGADVNIPGGEFGCALRAAISKAFTETMKGPEHDRIVQLLVSCGANTNVGDETLNKWTNRQVSRSALQTACRNEDLDRVRLLLAKRVDVNHRSGGTFDTALQEAAYYGFPLICEALLDSGANVHIQGGHLGNALQAAVAGNGGREPYASGRCEHIVRLLLEKGADVNAQGGYYGNALQAACAIFGSNKTVVILLLQKGANVNARGGYYGTALQAAAACGDKDMNLFHILLTVGADVNIPGGVFGYALRAAISKAVTTRWKRSHEDRIVQVLLVAGANSNVGNETLDNGTSRKLVSYTDLQMACQFGKLDRVRRLLAKGADVNYRSGGDFDTALQLAAHVGYYSICEALLDSGADIHIQGGRYGNALQAAVVGDFGENRNVDGAHIVRLLLEKGADVNAQGGYYGNALQAACAIFDCDKAVVMLLLQKGANVNARGGCYGTALQAAAACGHKDMHLFDILLKAGADVNIPGGVFGCALRAAISKADNSSSNDPYDDCIVQLLLAAGANTIVGEETLNEGMKAERSRAKPRKKASKNKTLAGVAGANSNVRDETLDKGKKVAGANSNVREETLDKGKKVAGANSNVPEETLDKGKKVEGRHRKPQKKASKKLLRRVNK